MSDEIKSWQQSKRRGSLKDVTVQYNTLFYVGGSKAQRVSEIGLFILLLYVSFFHFFLLFLLALVFTCSIFVFIISVKPVAIKKEKEKSFGLFEQ